MKQFPLKTVGIVVGGLFAVAHVGLLGYLMQENKPDYPVINFPSGDYSSYEVEATKDGYVIKYKANDPAILNSNRTLELDKHKKHPMLQSPSVNHQINKSMETKNLSILPN